MAFMAQTSPLITDDPVTIISRMYIYLFKQVTVPSEEIIVQNVTNTNQK